jgi:hypothetical protein
MGLEGEPVHFGTTPGGVSSVRFVGPFRSGSLLYLQPPLSRCMLVKTPQERSRTDYLSAGLLADTGAFRSGELHRDESSSSTIKGKGEIGSLKG